MRDLLRVFRKNPATPGMVCPTCGSPREGFCTSAFHVTHDDAGKLLPNVDLRKGRH